MNSIIFKFFFLTPNSGSFTQLSNRHLHIDISKLLKMKLPNLNSPCFRSIFAPQNCHFLDLSLSKCVNYVRSLSISFFLLTLASQVLLMVKNLPANAKDIRGMGSICGSGRYPGEDNGNPLQYSFFFLFINFLKFIYFLLKDNCFTEFCCFLSNLNMNQPQVYTYPRPFETPSRLPPHPTLLG